MTPVLRYLNILALLLGDLALEAQERMVLAVPPENVLLCRNFATPSIPTDRIGVFTDSVIGGSI